MIDIEAIVAKENCLNPTRQLVQSGIRMINCIGLASAFTSGDRNRISSLFRPNCIDSLNHLERDQSKWPLL